MSYKDLKPGHRYFTTWGDKPNSTNSPITFISIDQTFGENDALITVEVFGRLYSATAFQMVKEAI